MLDSVTQGDIEQRHGFATLLVRGDLDCATAPVFRENVALLRRHPAVAIDLSGVPFIDSAGLGALMGGVRRIREVGGVVAVCCPRPSVARVLSMTGFDRIATLYPSLQQAAAVLLRPSTATG